MQQSLKTPERGRLSGWLGAHLEAPPRALLFYFAVLLQLVASALSGIGFLLDDPAYFFTGTAVWVLWFVAMFMMTLPATDRLIGGGVNFLRRAAGVIFVVFFAVGILEIFAMTVLYPTVSDETKTGQFGEVMQGLNKVFVYNDSTALVQQASENLLEGKNPYNNANIITGLLKFDGAYDRVTPLRVGRFTDVFPYPTPEQLKEVWDEAILNPTAPPPEIESRVCYPAGSFVLPAPFIALGISNIRFVYGILVLAGLVFAVWWLPGRRRLIFIGAMLISLEMWNSIGAGETSLLGFPLLLVAWLTLPRKWWVSAIFMGVAVAAKQTAWFVAPFYLILFLRTYPPPRVAAGLGIIVAAFTAFNLPFAIADPGAWVSSVASPMTDPMFPIGVGLVTLVTTGLVNLQSSLPFVILEVLAIVGGCIWYYRNCRRYPHTGLILAVLPLFFAWRSLWTYFFYLGSIALVAVLADTEPAAPELSARKAVNT